jgi:hypothetical protein
MSNKNTPIIFALGVFVVLIASFYALTFVQQQAMAQAPEILYGNQTICKAAVCPPQGNTTNMTIDTTNITSGTTDTTIDGNQTMCKAAVCPPQGNTTNTTS